MNISNNIEFIFFYFRISNRCLTMEFRRSGQGIQRVTYVRCLCTVTFVTWIWLSLCRGKCLKWINRVLPFTKRGGTNHECLERSKKSVNNVIVESLLLAFLFWSRTTLNIASLFLIEDKRAVWGRNCKVLQKYIYVKSPDIVSDIPMQRVNLN